jgi:hypothetical protein
VKRGRMQCKDIPDELIIRAIASTPGYWRSWLDVQARFDALMPAVPFTLFVAKVGSMEHRGTVHACVHRAYSGGQCAGRLHLPGECTGC